MKIAEWPSTHANLIAAWAAMIVSIILSWVIVLWKIDVNEAVYYFTMSAVFAWAGITAPAALIGKRATEKPEMRRKTVTAGDPPVTTTLEESTATPKEGE
jgi:hypothetical protein